MEMLGAKAVDDFKASLDPDSNRTQGDIARAADQVMAKLEFAYGLAARLAHREPSLEGTQAIRARMVALCDALAAQPRSLATAGPAACVRG
jgi:hypothetical protein